MFMELYKFSKLVMHLNSCFMDLGHDTDRSLNRKRKRFKVFEVKPKSNHDDVIINLITI